MKTVRLSEIQEKWEALSLPVERFQEICSIGNFVDSCEWRWFLAIAASDLCSVSYLSIELHFLVTCIANVLCVVLLFNSIQFINRPM